MQLDRAKRLQELEKENARLKRMQADAILGKELPRGIGVSEVGRFNIPQFFRADEDLRIIEMTMVPPPFVLDFAEFWLDAPPSPSDEIGAA